LDSQLWFGRKLKKCDSFWNTYLAIRAPKQWNKNINPWQREILAVSKKTR
jgi:hypothetical protein